jgi:uncharacterized protein (TIGR03118 family)
MKQVMMESGIGRIGTNELPTLRGPGAFTGRKLGLNFGAAALALVLAGAPAAFAADSGDHRAPEVPLDIAAPAGTKVAFHGFAVGFQIYTWDGVSWGNAVPSATLFDDQGHVVATHFAGPSWQSRSGSVVVGAVVPPRVTVDEQSIPWLLLHATTNSGPGIFAHTPWIQRIHTAGGKAPAANGTVIGQVAEVPYTADYYFFREVNGAENRFYHQVNLVSDQFGVALLQDTNLVNAWGTAFSPTSPFWVSDNGSGRATLYAVTNDATGSPVVVKQSLEVTIPGAANVTGMVLNNTTNFHGNAFLFVSEDGIISGWRGALGTAAEVLATRSNAVYKGVTLVSTAGGPVLLAANFAAGTVDAFDGNMTLIGQLSDPNAPAGYAPFNVQAIAGNIFVTFARQDADKQDEVAGPGHGLIDVLDLSTRQFRRFVTGSDAGGRLTAIDSPWGVAVAPPTFGKHADQLLVGNFGNGTIMAFDDQGQFQGLLESSRGQAVVIDGLWALTFGSGGRAGVPRTLYFTAGPGGERHGLFGSLESVGEPESR